MWQPLTGHILPLRQNIQSINSVRVGKHRWAYGIFSKGYVINCREIGLEFIFVAVAMPSSPIGLDRPPAVIDNIAYKNTNPINKARGKFLVYSLPTSKISKLYSFSGFFCFRGFY